VGYSVQTTARNGNCFHTFGTDLKNECQFRSAHCYIFGTINNNVCGRITNVQGGSNITGTICV
jgi:hypothetical protein